MSLVSLVSLSLEHVSVCSWTWTYLQHGQAVDTQQHDLDQRSNRECHDERSGVLLSNLFDVWFGVLVCACASEGVSGY